MPRDLAPPSPDVRCLRPRRGNLGSRPFRRAGTRDRRPQRSGAGGLASLRRMVLRMAPACGCLSPKSAGIGRNEHGRRHFGALTRRRGRRFGADLACGARDARTTASAVKEGAVRVDARRCRTHRVLGHDGTRHRRNRQRGPRDAIRLLDVASQADSRPPLGAPSSTETPSGAGRPGRVNETGPLAVRNRRKAVRLVRLRARCHGSPRHHPIRRASEQERRPRRWRRCFGTRAPARKAIVSRVSDPGWVRKPMEASGAWLAATPAGRNGLDDGAKP